MKKQTEGLVVFDLDSTLAISKTPMDSEMAGLISSLLEVTKTAVISGGAFVQFEEQFLSALNVSEEKLSCLYLLPTSGTVFYKYENSWQLVYEEVLSDKERKQIFEAFEKVLKEVNFDESQTSFGLRLEDRGSQITFSALGQYAPWELKKDWDPDKKKRNELRDRLLPLLPELEVRTGGSTSIDITKKGIDKAYGIKKLEEELGIPKDEMIFIGDRLEIGGNDYPALGKSGLVSVHVSGPEGTKKIIKHLLQDEVADDI